jgi:hypothetical protein
MEKSDPNNWNASLENSFALRSGVLVRPVSFYLLFLTHARWLFQLMAEVGVVSFTAATTLLAITVVSIFSSRAFDSYESLAPPTA